MRPNLRLERNMEGRMLGQSLIIDHLIDQVKKIVYEAQRMVEKIERLIREVQQVGSHGKQLLNFLEEVRSQYDQIMCFYERNCDILNKC